MVILSYADVINIVNLLRRTRFNAFCLANNYISSDVRAKLTIVRLGTTVLCVGKSPASTIVLLID